MEIKYKLLKATLELRHFAIDIDLYERRENYKKLIESLLSIAKEIETHFDDLRSIGVVFCHDCGKPKSDESYLFPIQVGRTEIEVCESCLKFREQSAYDKAIDNRIEQAIDEDKASGSASSGVFAAFYPLLPAFPEADPEIKETNGISCEVKGE